MFHTVMKKFDLLLYAVTDRGNLLNGRTLADAVSDALSGGVTIVQYREKNILDKGKRISEAGEILDRCHAKNVPLIIDDDIELAISIGADGVHVGQSDTPPLVARQLIGPDMILGVTAKSRMMAVSAEAAGADYLGCGALFSTSTKSDAVPMSIETLKDITGSVRIPVVAIGGINEKNVRLLSGTRIAGAAVSGGIFAQDDIREAARSLKSSLIEIV